MFNGRINREMIERIEHEDAQAADDTARLDLEDLIEMLTQGVEIEDLDD
jgi:hypothetical protein